ncbi:MAG: amidohydrolase [Planctomycetaceae bacterium]
MNLSRVEPKPAFRLQAAIRRGVLLFGGSAVGVLIGLTSPACADKPALLQAVDRRSEQAWGDARQIWEWAEPGYQEHRSSALLSERLQQAGFKIEKGVAGIPTAFVARIGEGSPVLGLLAEFDALPGLSQEALPERKSREAGGYGHACGHHLFGVASVTAAMALAEQIQDGQHPGTILVFGCPAEEGGAGKVFMTRAGLFGQCDAILHWHPGNRNAAGDASTLARMSAKFRFHGKAAHAAAAPQEGRSALDGVELMNHAAQLLREHTPEQTRIHHVITAGGDAPNVVPEFAEVYYYVRHPSALTTKGVFDRLVLCARGAALATETRLEIEHHGGTLEVLPNRILAEVASRNLRELNRIGYSEDELSFALRLRETLNDPPGLETLATVFDQSGTVVRGSTDVGDVSWVVPTTGFTTACWVPGTPSHSWQAVAAGGMSIGRQGMLLAARVLAATAWDMGHDQALLTAARAELDRRLGERRYTPLMPAEVNPILDYRSRSKD